MSRALSLLLALALPACSVVEDHYLGGEDLAPVDAGGILDVGTFPFDIDECEDLQKQLTEYVSGPGLDEVISEQCRQSPFMLDCPQRDLLRQVYDCAGRIRQRFLDEANANGLANELR